MAKSNEKNRAEKRQERRAADTANGPYKMRSAASRRAEARARAAYRGVEPGLDGPEDMSEVYSMTNITTTDVGIRPNFEANPRPRPKKQKFGDMDASLVAQLLHNPTRQVSEATLKAQYNYVVADIRSMALLAAGLFALLIVLAFVLPQ